MTKFEFDEEIIGGCRYVASFARLKYHGLERHMVPDPAVDTATVTFIRVHGKTYACTAFHVIEFFQRSAESEGIRFEGYMCLQQPGVMIGGPFIRAPREYPFSDPDVAICPVHEDLPARIGKVAFEVLPSGDATWPVSHAIGFGFPTLEKRDVEDDAGSLRMGLSCVHVVAEGLSSPGTSDQIQFHSELIEKPSVRSLSGMSGGPVFWSDGNRHGLVGLIKEAFDVVPKGDVENFYTEPKANFICQRADYSIINR